MGEIETPKLNHLLNRRVFFGASFPRLLINGFLFLGFLVTLLPAADSLRKRERVLIPLENPIVEAYATKISLMTRSMFLGIFVLSFVQGISMGIFYHMPVFPIFPLFSLSPIYYVKLLFREN